MSFAEFMVASTMAIVGLGMVYALRRQGNNFQILDTANLQQRVTQLESANRYLLQQIDDEREHNRIEITALKKDNELLRGLLLDIQQEARDLKSKRDELINEVAGLRSAIKRQ